MILRGLKNGAWKCVATVVAASLSLTLLPADGRCDEEPNQRCGLQILIQMVKPQKPQVCKPTWTTTPCCPMGVCTGAGSFCCPVAADNARTGRNVLVSKPERCGTTCCDRACCEKAASCCQPDRTTAEMRALCAEQARILREMHVMINALHRDMAVLQAEIQAMRQNQVGLPNGFPPQFPQYPPPPNPYQHQMPYPMPMPMPNGGPSVPSQFYNFTAPVMPSATPFKLSPSVVP